MTDHGAVGPHTGPAGLLNGRYRLVRRVGRGGMADVFAAEDEVLSRTVAVKRFRFDTDGGDDQRRIDAEIRTLAALRHPGLVMVLDAGTETGAGHAPFVVMELIAGPTLGQRVAQGALIGAEAAGIGADLAEALAYVHGQGIVHRDVKPANILLEPKPAEPGRFSAKLADFGIARLVDSTGITLHGATIGTANYLSPEQARSSDVGAASDIYSLGLVLIECLTGRIAYPGTGINAAIARLHHPPAIPAEVGAVWSALLTAMTDSDPAGRPTAAECALRLRAIGAAQPPHAVGAARPPTVVTGACDATQLLLTPPGAESTRVLEPATTLLRASRRHAPPWWVYSVAAAVVVVAVLIAISTRGGRDTTYPSQAPPTYPSVSGQLGTDLHELEVIVG